MPEPLNTLFAQHGLKITDARSAILRVLKAARSPMSYEQMKVQMEQAMDKATFYRIPIGIPVSDQQMSSFFDSKLGLKYSFLDAFYAYIGKTLKDEDRWQCVELANYFYRSIGIDVGPVYVPNRFVRALMGKTGQPLVYYGPLTLGA